MTNRMHILACSFIVAAVALVARPAAAQPPTPTAAPAAQAPAPAAAQPTGLQAALLNDVDNLSNKFTGLARVMAGKYDWRPGQGVRSVADVFNLVVNGSKTL